MRLSDKYTALDKYTLLIRAGINTPLRLAHFFAQLEYESNFKLVPENLNYSAEALLLVFPKYFPAPELADEYARKPIKIGNRVYANRMENGDEASGDGYEYRGRGYIQITGRRNYRLLSEATGIDFLNKPHLLLEEEHSMTAAVWYWSVNNLNALADADDLRGVTKRINGGYNGLEGRRLLLDKYKLIFKA